MHKYISPLLALILAFAFFTRVWQLYFPEQYIFDAVYHAVTAKLIARNDPVAYEWWHGAPEPNTAIDWLHPPLAKYTQAVGMLAFGETTFGWRISSALFGVGVVYLTYLLTKKLADEETGLLAAFLASLDGLLLVQSRIAMNDIHVTFFILLTLLVYLQYREQVDSKRAFRWLFLTGVSAGLAMGSKWSGVFVVGIVGIFQTGDILIKFQQVWASSKKKYQTLRKQLLLTILGSFLFLGVAPFIIYLASYGHMFLQGKSLFCHQPQYIQGECYYERIDLTGLAYTLIKPAIMSGLMDQEGAATFTQKFLMPGYVSHFHELHRQIWHYQTNLEATHSYQSRPWQWFLNLRPVWYYVKYGETTLANVYAFGNPALFWVGDLAVGVTLLGLGFHLVTRLRLTTLPALIKKAKVWPLTFMTVSYFMVWLPWQLSPRIMFFYHYTPAVPLLCIILAFWLIRLKAWRYQKREVGKYLMAACVVLMTLCFIVWYPNWTGTPVPKWVGENVYFAIPTWK